MITLIIAVLLLVLLLSGTPLIKKEVNIFMLEDMPHTRYKVSKLKISILIILLLLLFIVNTYTIDIGKKIDISSASLIELQSIDGIGIVKSELIFEHIKKYGLTNYDELLIIDGIGDETIKELKKRTYNEGVTK